MFDFSRLMQFMHRVVSAAAFHIHTLVDHVCSSGENLFLSSHTLQTEHAAGFESCGFKNPEILNHLRLELRSDHVRTQNNIFVIKF